MRIEDGTMGRLRQCLVSWLEKGRVKERIAGK